MAAWRLKPGGIMSAVNKRGVTSMRRGMVAKQWPLCVSLLAAMVASKRDEI